MVVVNWQLAVKVESDYSYDKTNHNWSYLDRVLGYVLLLAVSNSSSLEAISDSLIIKVNDNNVLKSTCDVNLLSKLAIILKEWRVIVLFVLLRSHKEQTI
jgi:hypothetical protein